MTHQQPAASLVCQVLRQCGMALDKRRALQPLRPREALIPATPASSIILKLAWGPVLLAFFSIHTAPDIAVVLDINHDTKARASLLVVPAWGQHGACQVRTSHWGIVSATH